MSLSRSSLLFCLVVAARAQTAAPAASSHSHTPAPSAHGQGVVTLDQFVTTASPVPRNQVDVAQATTVLAGAALLLKQQATLGETLSAETGIQATAFGPGASRPIIRGLGGDRIRLLENSIGTLDASVTSPDHAVSVEPLLVERIEVLRGPAALLYGSSAVGGVVNVITHRIETDLPTEPVRGLAELRGGGAADEFAGGGVLDFAARLAPDHALVFHVDAFRRETGDLRIPGFAEAAGIREEEIEHAREEGEAAPAFVRGRLPNSALDTRSGAAGVSYVTKEFHFGGSYSGFDSNYGVPGHAHEGEGGVRIDLRQRRVDLQGEWHADAGTIRGARFKFGRSQYRHREVEPDGAVGTTFDVRGHEGRAELLHGDGQPWSGAFGAQTLDRRLNAQGDEAFLPPSRTRSHAVFAFEEIELAPLTWQFGARWERTRIAADARPTRTDDELGASAGVVWKLDRVHALSLSVAHTGRPANAQELFADGPHAGTGSFEIGDPALRAERSLAVEVSLRRRAGLVTGALTGFMHRFDGYIFEDARGEVALEEADGWRIADGEDAGHDHGHEALPVYRYAQRDARFHGVELETIWHLHESGAAQLDLRLAGDLTRASAAGQPLPRIPAARITGGLAWTDRRWALGAECQVVRDQRRVAANETPSDGYTLVSASVTRRFELEHLTWEAFVRGTNLLDEEARPHPSFVKDLAPLGGRGVVAGVRVSF